jgi:hypothetical protein
LSICGVCDWLEDNIEEGGEEMMFQEMKEKVGVVTGAISGIGRASAASKNLIKSIHFNV